MRTVAAPTAMGTVIRTGASCPEVRIRHREYIGDLVHSGSAPFRAHHYEINPAQEEMFPWLANVAKMFETYEFMDLSFEFVTMRPTTATGFVAICPDWDAADDNSTLTKAEFLAFEDSVRGPIWENVVCTASRHNLKRGDTHFTRAAVAPSGTDIKTYDIGQVDVLVYDSGGTVTVGELWVSYDILLSTPQVSDDDPGVAILTSDSTSMADPYYDAGLAPAEVVLDTGLDVSPPAAVTQICSLAEAGTYLGAIEHSGVGLTDTADLALAPVYAGDSIAHGPVVISSGATKATRQFLLKIGSGHSMSDKLLLSVLAPPVGTSLLESTIRLATASPSLTSTNWRGGLPP